MVVVLLVAEYVVVVLLLFCCFVVWLLLFVLVVLEKVGGGYGNCGGRCFPFAFPSGVGISHHMHSQQSPLRCPCQKSFLLPTCSSLAPPYSSQPQ